MYFEIKITAIEGSMPVSGSLSMRGNEIVTVKNNSHSLDYIDDATKSAKADLLVKLFERGALKPDTDFNKGVANPRKLSDNPQA